MKAKSFLLIALSCLLVVGCKKSDDSNAEEQFTKITEEQVKSYFPYAVDDRQLFISNIGYLYYTVAENSFTNTAGKMNIKVLLNGKDVYGSDYCTVELKAEVTDNKILKVDFTHSFTRTAAHNIIGSYTFDASKGEDLSDEITLSCGAIIKKNVGLLYYKDYSSYEWNLYTN